MTRAFVFLLTLLGVFLLPEFSAAQTPHFRVSGSVQDSLDTPLPNATVVLLTRADPVITRFVSLIEKANLH